jgi:hypothetical protein
MSDTITTYTGLLSQKPTSPAPRAGEQRYFSWQNKTSKKGNDWIKVKNEQADYGGQLCEIISSEQTDYKDAHGNVSFNVEFSPITNGAPNNQKAAESYVERNPPLKPAELLDARQRAIIRQHSQAMSLKVLELKCMLGQLAIEDLTPSKLKTLADYFDNDVTGATQ